MDVPRGHMNVVVSRHGSGDDAIRVSCSQTIVSKMICKYPLMSPGDDSSRMLFAEVF